MPPADKAHQNEFLIPFLMIRRYDRKPLLLSHSIFLDPSISTTSSFTNP